MCWLLYSLCSLLSCLLRALHSLCDEKCFFDDGYQWRRVLHFCSSGLLPSIKIFWNLRDYPWSGSHTDALWKITDRCACDYPCVFANDWFRWVSGRRVFSPDSCSSIYLVIEMSFVISYVVGTFFMDVFGVASDTVLLCYCLELDILKGLSYACPPGLKEVLDFQRKWYYIKASTSGFLDNSTSFQSLKTSFLGY